MILYILIILLLLYILASTSRSNEGFENKVNEQLYCKIYDHI